MAFKLVYRIKYQSIAYIIYSIFIPAKGLDQNRNSLVRRCSVKKVFLKSSQNSQETLVPESLFK